MIGRKDPNGDPDPADQENGQPPVQDEDRSGKTLKAIKKKDRQGHSHRGQGCGLQDVLKVNDARISPHSAIQVEIIECEKLCGEDEGQSRFDIVPLPLGDVAFEPQGIRRKVGQGHEKRIESDHQVEMTVSDQAFQVTTYSNSGSRIIPRPTPGPLSRPGRSSRFLPGSTTGEPVTSGSFPPTPSL